MSNEYRETVFSHDIYMDKDRFCVDASEAWSIRMVKRLKNDYPDEVEVRHENKDGSLQAYMPLTWMRIVPKKKIALTDEQRLNLSARMKDMNRTKKTRGLLEKSDRNFDGNGLDV